MLVLPLVLTPGCTPAIRGWGHIRCFQVLGLSSEDLKIRLTLPLERRKIMFRSKAAVEIKEIYTDKIDSGSHR